MISTLNFFWTYFWQFLVRGEKFSAAPPRTPPFLATENSALWPFLAENRCFFSLCGAVEPPNGAGFMKFFLETLLDIFGPGRKFFGHPAPTTRIFGHRNFCIWPFLGEKMPKIAIFRLFRFKIGQKRTKIKKIFFFTKLFFQSILFRI